MFSYTGKIAPQAQHATLAEIPSETGVSLRQWGVNVVQPAGYVCCAYQVTALAVLLGVELGALKVGTEFDDAFLALDCFGLACTNDGLQAVDVVHGEAPIKKPLDGGGIGKDYG